MSLRSTASILLACLSPAAASAACGLPETVEGVPRGVAKYLLESSDAVGIGVVRHEARADGTRAERFVLTLPFKGAAGDYKFEDQRTASGDIIVTSAFSSRTGRADGALALLALQVSDGVARIGECQAAALSSVPLEHLLQELRQHR